MPLTKGRFRSISEFSMKKYGYGLCFYQKEDSGRSVNFERESKVIAYAFDKKEDSGRSVNCERESKVIAFAFDKKKIQVNQ